MSLRITLKPGEKLLIGRNTIVNGPLPADFRLHGERVPILRGSEILDESQINSPCSRLYFNIQRVYLSQDNDAIGQNDILKEAEAINSAAPSLKIYIADVMSYFLLGEYYKSLQSCRRLMSEERQLLDGINIPAKQAPKRSIN